MCTYEIYLYVFIYLIFLNRLSIYVDTYCTYIQKRYYCTGDIIKKINRYFFCVGRSDTQVKLRGYRIDTTEIESHVKKIEGINYCYCYLSKKLRESHLVLLCLINLKDINEIKILSHLKKHLPNYMIPKKIVIEKKLKFNKNGKVDKTFYKSKY